jgi:hypothetical protein
MQYHVLPITKETLLQGFEDVVDPADVEACAFWFPKFLSLLNSFLAPFGWHSDGTATINTTDTS